MPLKFPGPDDRLAVVGRTGSGKTTAGMWHLSGKNFNAQPWVIVNTKGDPFINELAAIEGVKSIGVNQTPGDKGLYIVTPLPDEDAQLDEFFHRCWEKENVGLYIDEGYMIGITNWFNACLTQGRSRRVPMIVLSQRPAWISKFVFSECEFVQLFNLQIRDDRKKIGELVPVDKNYRLPEYHSYWYNVKSNELISFGPVPEHNVILENFRAFFPPKAAQAGTEQHGILQTRRLRVV